MAWAWLSVRKPRWDGENMGLGVGQTRAEGLPYLLAVASDSFLRWPPLVHFLL